MKPENDKDFTATTNPCKLCAPLGASLAFLGVERAIPLLHGSQGCATYMRRYLISHFKEPVDIASSNFSEETAIFGGGKNLRQAVDNIRRQYSPALIGIATTCLSETIGDDVRGIVGRIRSEGGAQFPEIVPVSTPSYRGTHYDGFLATVLALVENLASLPPEANGKQAGLPSIGLFPGILSPADIRHLKEMVEAFGISPVILPDYSERLDAGPWPDYRPIQDGGTTVEKIRGLGRSLASVVFGGGASAKDPGSVLENRFGVPSFRMGLPVGVRETDRFFSFLGELGATTLPPRLSAERERLIDALVDGHKYVSGARAVVYGDPDLAAGLTFFLREIGVHPVLCASGSRNGYLTRVLGGVSGGPEAPAALVCEGADFSKIEEEAARLKPDLLVGSSKGYQIARRLKIPLVRVGFPIHDRIGGPRILHVGYRGALRLFDRLVNALLSVRQEASQVGYAYM